MHRHPPNVNYSLGTFVRSKKLASSFRCSFMSLCVFVLFFFLPTVFVSCSFIKRSDFIPQCSCFQVREHRSVTDFHGSQPQETLHIPTSLCTLKDSSHLHLLKIFHGIVIFVDICIYLLSCFGHSKLRTLRPPGYSECSRSMKLQTLGQKASHLRVQQSTGSHGSCSQPPPQIRRPSFPNWDRSGLVWYFYGEKQS